MRDDWRMRTALLTLACLLAAACASPRQPSEAVTRRYIVVRHAEKADASRDPELSAAGRARAQALATRLAELPLVAAYATEFKRTAQTLAPTVEAHGLTLTSYPAAAPAVALAARLRAAHPRGTVLIAGHSNTVPAIVAALCACAAAPMPEQEYDRLSIVELAPDGRARLTVERYGAPSP